MMRWKLRVKDRRGNWHVHRFADAEAAYRHWWQYDLDGICEVLEVWQLRKKIVATGEPGEEVWFLVQRYNLKG